MCVQTIHEDKLLGTAGTLLVNQSFFNDATGLLIHADNAMEGDLRSLLKTHADRIFPRVLCLQCSPFHRQIIHIAVE